MDKNIKNNKFIFAIVGLTLGLAIGFFIGKITYVERDDISNVKHNDFDTSMTIDNPKSDIDADVPIEGAKDQYEKILDQYKTYLSTIHVGDSLLFGKYEQDNNIYNGKEDIEWIVLYKSNKNSMLLISKYILDCMPYNFMKKEVVWQDCDLRNFLNNEFYEEAFDDNNKMFIMENDMTNSANINYKTDAGNETKDKIFLLSESQAKKYFDDIDKKNHSKKRSAIPTEYAKQKGVATIIDKNEWYDGNASYWLRTPGVDQSRVEIIEPTGEIFLYGELVSSIEIGVRPCIWIKY